MSFRLPFFPRQLRGVWLGLLVLAFLAQDAIAQQAPAAKAPVTIILDGSESPEALKKLIDSISAQDRAVSISFAPKASVAARAAADKEAQSEQLFDLFLRGLQDGWHGIPKASEYFSSFSRWWQSPPMSPGFVPYLLKLVVVLGVAAIAGWLVLSLLRSVRPQRLPAADPAPLDQKLRPALGRLVRDIGAVVAFIAVARLLAAYLFEPAAAEGKLTDQLLNVVPAIAGYVVVGRFLLSPDEPRLQLFMLPRAKRHFTLLVIYAVVTMTLLAIFVGLDDEIGAASTVSGIFLTVTTLALLFRVWWFWDARGDIAAVIFSGGAEAAEPGILRRLFAIATPWFLILCAVLLWAIGRVAVTVPDGEKWVAAGAATQVLVILVPILAVGASILARQRLMTDDPSRTPLQVALRTLAVKLSGAAAWLFGLALLGWTWSHHLLESRSVEGLAALRGVITLIAVAVAGWALTSFLDALFNAYSPRAQSAVNDEDHAVAAAAVQTRLGSILPILRGFTVGAVIGLTVLLALSQLGFDIAPLLAGFGILGLAISFGSQTLVKDIVAGFFFMVEDAFRVGEYIDTGKLKGTIEKINLRSLQLRHGSGLVHTIPFGTLSSVTNASRDWSTVKFSLRLDRATDIEKARKTIKKIGIEMQADPEFGSAFVSPLKMQGVDEIADAAIVVQAKFTAQPPMAGSIQREALKRIYPGFKEAGIEFASNAVTVRGGGQAEAAAAATASVQPIPLPAA